MNEEALQKAARLERAALYAVTRAYEAASCHTRYLFSAEAHLGTALAALGPDYSGRRRALDQLAHQTSARARSLRAEAAQVDAELETPRAEEVGRVLRLVTEALDLLLCSEPGLALGCLARALNQTAEHLIADAP